jgi:hypothetical protein
MFSWQILDSGVDLLKGPLSKEYGFVPDPWIVTNAEVILPADWENLWHQLPEYYAKLTLREYCENLKVIDVDTLYEKCKNNVWSFLKTKSVVFNIAQAWVDCERKIGNDHVMTEDIDLPDAIKKTIEHFCKYCNCPDYCTLADISLTSAELVTDKFDVFNCHFDDLRLLCPVNGALRKEEQEEGNYEAAEIRRVVESRFHLMPTIMEYRTCDLALLVSETQKLIYKYNIIEKEKTAKSDENQEQKQIGSEIVDLLKRIESSFVRLRQSFEFLKHSTVNPVVWHSEIVKFTAGYGGHKGASGPQTPAVHLIDAFLGRETFESELGELMLQVRKQLQHNHQAFIKSVEKGPSIRQLVQYLSEESPNSPIIQAYNSIVREYTQGFLTIHSRKALTYAKAGFGETNTPRIFTAGTQYKWVDTEGVLSDLKVLFKDAQSEREELEEG